MNPQTKAEQGGPWSGKAGQLKLVENVNMVVRLVTLDTLLLNRDRYPPVDSGRKPNYDNVFLSEEGANPGRFRMVAMDYTDCLSAQSELSVNIANIRNIQDDRIYGLFPGFYPYLDKVELNLARSRLCSLKSDVAQQIINSTPVEWKVQNRVKVAISSFLVGRAAYLARNMEKMMFPFLAKQDNLKESEEV